MVIEFFSFLTFYAAYSGGDSIGYLFSQWQQYGFFSYLLPFLLLFSLILGILVRINIFNNNGVNGVIAFTIALMSLQFDFVPTFFQEVFPRLGIGITIILIILILLGFFLPINKSWVAYAFLGIGALILGVVLVKSAAAVGWSSGYWWEENWPVVVGAIFILILVGIIVSSFSSSSSPSPETILLKQLK